MDKQPMSVSVERPSAEVVVVRIAGDLGLGAMTGKHGEHTGVAGDTALEKALLLHVPDPRGVIIVDLSETTYLSSLGIGTLLRFRNRVTKAGGHVRVVATDAMVTLLKTGRLDQLFTMYPTLAAATQG